MNDTTVLSSAERAEKLQGLGCKRRRVEDARFIQGKGNYVDDLKLPGMLYGDFARSPYAHARVKKIDASKAKALPGVLAVLTAADLKPLGQFAAWPVPRCLQQGQQLQQPGRRVAHVLSMPAN